MTNSYDVSQQFDGLPTSTLMGLVAVRTVLEADCNEAGITVSWCDNQTSVVLSYTVEAEDEPQALAKAEAKFRSPILFALAGLDSSSCLAQPAVVKASVTEGLQLAAAA